MISDYVVFIAIAVILLYVYLYFAW